MNAELALAQLRRDCDGEDPALTFEITIEDHRITAWHHDPAELEEAGGILVFTDATGWLWTTEKPPEKPKDPTEARRAWWDAVRRLAAARSILLPNEMLLDDREARTAYDSGTSAWKYVQHLAKPKVIATFTQEGQETVSHCLTVVTERWSRKHFAEHFTRYGITHVQDADGLVTVDEWLDGSFR